MRRAISLAGLGIALAGVAIGMGSVRPAPIKVVETYERKCSSCHGKEGAMLDKDFEKKYASPSELREVGRACRARLACVPTSWTRCWRTSRAVSRREPFVVWTGRQGDALLGEVSPATARVEARAKREKLRVERPQPNQWRIVLPKGVQARGCRTYGAARYSAYHAAPQGLPLQPHEISYAAKSLSALRASAFSGSMSSAMRNCSRASAVRPISRSVIAKFNRASR
jgi:hypothetical protein